MTHEAMWLKVVDAAKKTTGIDIRERGGGRSSVGVSHVAGIVYTILSTYYSLRRTDVAELAGIDHGSVSYHVIRHDKRIKTNEKYKTRYDNIIEELFDIDNSDRYCMINELIEQL